MNKLTVYQIYKYFIDDTTDEITVPKGSKILCAKNQNELIVVYIQVTTSTETESYFFDSIPTGHYKFDETWNYLDTVLVDSGKSIWHIYYKKRR